MSEVSKIEAITATVQNRRAFVKTAAKVAVTAPAAALLLNAAAKPAKAAESLYRAQNDDTHFQVFDDGPDDGGFIAGDDIAP